MKFLDKAGVAKLWEKIVALANTRVEKIEGKSLSTNDFTNEYKNTLDDMTKIYVQAELPPEDAPIGALWVDTSTTAIISAEGVAF